MKKKSIDTSKIRCLVQHTIRECLSDIEDFDERVDIFCTVTCSLLRYLIFITLMLNGCDKRSAMEDLVDQIEKSMNSLEKNREFNLKKSTSFKTNLGNMLSEDINHILDQVKKRKN